MKSVTETIEIAYNAHKGQFRKNMGGPVQIPYVFHCIEVADMILKWGTANEDMVRAALCHDILEDNKAITREYLREEIGITSTYFVMELTNIGYDTKEKYLDTLAKGSIESLIIKLADRICNTKDFYRNNPSYAEVYFRKAKKVTDAIVARKKEIEEKFGVESTQSLMNSLGDMINWHKDIYYRTVSKDLVDLNIDENKSRAIRLYYSMYDKYRDNFVEDPSGYVFGTIAVRKNEEGRAYNGFYTTLRGKKEMNGELVYVRHVFHEGDRPEVHVEGLDKASLNAPLLDNIFKNLPNVQFIVHYHNQYAGLETFPFAQPGTVRDSDRNITKSFNIADHGCFFLLDFNKKILW